MASFNRHWPSMFRSKHAAQPWQTQPDMSSSPSSLLSGSTTTTGCSLKHSSGGEERSPDPKPRWNPRPEQIRILEAIFNSGMVNPPRDEIPRIRMRLQEYGQVGDANVFYWFQNRKSRSKNKLRTGSGGRAAPARAPPARQGAAPITPPPAQPQAQQVQLLASPVQAPTSSSSSSSDRSSGSSKPAAKLAAQGMSATAAMDLLDPLAAACPQMYYHGHPVAPASAPAPKAQELVAPEDPIFLPLPQGYYLSAAEVAAILGAQYMHVPAQLQAPALPTGTFLGQCNEVTGPTITGHRSCAWGAGLGQYWPGGGADHHQLGKNAAASNTVAREVAQEDATKPGLLQYGLGVVTAVDTASAAATLPLAASPDASVTIASVTASTAGLTRFAASTAPNDVVANYDPLQELADAVGVTGARDAAVAVAAPTGAETVGARGFAVLCIMDSSTGKSVLHNDVPATKLDVMAQFGEAAVLFRCIGERPEHVPVDASGCTVEPLQHGAVYYVLV
ncbi:WUSCHEL-related homeobox 7-like [Phragmites australis]|uniref:WUSCHEL-related homeobox 7-like n=1 Tax=Phragmites australis TaxID=29695 RepID=UPI002D792A89|nr:WUSCHEL-related homeobox 7-like [Phragmites australis]